MTKLMRAVLVALLMAGVVTLAACNSETVSSPTVNTEQPTAVSSNPPANPAPNPSPTPTATEPEGDGYLIEFENNAGFKVTNTSGIGQAYRAYTTSFDNQELETAFKVSGTVPHNESWGDSFNASCVQLDITQHGVAGLPLKGGAAFFDKNGKQFNPSRNPEKVTECRTTPCKEEWVPVEYEDAGITAIATNDGGWGQCSPVPTVNVVTQVSCSQSRRVRNTCTGEVKTETQSCQCSCDLQNPPRASISGPTFLPYTPAQPAQYYYYWDMDNGQGDGPKQNACEGRGGVWLGDDYNIPNDGSNNEYDDVCRVTTGPAFPGGPGADVDFIKSVKTADAVSASGGNPISGSATFYNAGSWEVRLLSASSVGEYNANDPDYVKDSKEATVSCGSSTSRSVSYNWVGHDSEIWWVEVRLNGAFHSKSSYVTNPTN